jgi:hypothetical protein
VSFKEMSIFSTEMVNAFVNGSLCFGLVLILWKYRLVKYGSKGLL